MTFVTHLESTADGSRLPAGTLQTVHDGKPLLVRYDLQALGHAVSKEALRDRAPDLWRYAEFLPLADASHRVSLGEGMSPLLHCPRLGAELGMKHLYIKDESQLPTGSFKARGMCLAVSMAQEFGVRRVATPTAGNAGGALAAYAARAGMECYVFMPADTPIVNQLEAYWYGARAWLVPGLITDCGAIVREGVAEMGWFDMSTLREPYRIEGKKTMGLELAEQMDWELPEHIFYPTGGGTGLIGMWKAFDELATIGWIPDSPRPRMFSCQSDGCAPIARAWEQGLDHGAEISDPVTEASGLRVPKALGDFLILSAVRESGGQALATPEAGLRDLMSLATRLEGISLCPEAAACLGCLSQALAAGTVHPEDRTVIFNTGALQKYVEVLSTPLPTLDPHAIAWSTL